MWSVFISESLQENQGGLSSFPLWRDLQYNTEWSLGWGMSVTQQANSEVAQYWFSFTLVGLFPIYTSVHPLCLSKSIPADAAIGFPAQHRAWGHVLPSGFLGIILPLWDIFSPTANHICSQPRGWRWRAGHRAAPLASSAWQGARDQASKGIETDFLGKESAIPSGPGFILVPARKTVTP